MLTYYSTVELSLLDFELEGKAAALTQIIKTLFSSSQSTQYFLITESPQKHSLGFELHNPQIHKKTGLPFLINFFEDLQINDLLLIVESEEFSRGLSKIFIYNDTSKCSINDVSQLFYTNFHKKFITIYMDNDGEWLMIVNVPFDKNEAINILTPLLKRDN